ncbi:MAG: hypothetical protein LBP56_02360 [Odoribacteraceae bacterium]|jgi:nucleoid DNA-binding protein|nr:hypothetical protein [Odoribacteraceae bacterium]
METFISYIEELVYLHDQVIIPGIGALVGHHESAKIKEGRITPPLKKVLFNSQVRHDDGMLAIWIAQREGIDTRKARARVARLRDSLLERLEQGETIPFGTIGTFHADRKGRPRLEPSGHNFLADTAGMLPLVLPPTVTRRGDDTGEYIRAGSNVLARLFKYGLSAAVITGIIVISQSKLFQPDPHTGQASLQAAPPVQERRTAETVAIVSPHHDFIDYTPSL